MLFREMNLDHYIKLNPTPLFSELTEGKKI
jgi:hypothetical protein